jgi:hypothetical protein
VKRLKKRVFDKIEIVDGDHGRIERRRYWITNKIGWLTQKEH